MTQIPVLAPHDNLAFPPLECALQEPNGLLAAGGDLSTARLLEAYRQGIFPWYCEGEPILWWSPDPRLVFATDSIHKAKRLQRWLRHCNWTIRADFCFRAVMEACAKRAETWITPDMLDAYSQLHQQGHAHSIEVYADDQLVGGVYGLAVGHMFCAESMFSKVSNASKVALLALCQVLHSWGFPLLDAQVSSPHLRSLGGYEMPRQEFCERLRILCAEPGTVRHWQECFPHLRASDLA